MITRLTKLVLTLLLCFHLVSAKLLGTNIKEGSGVAEINTCRAGVAKLSFNFKGLGTGPYSLYWDAPCGYPPFTGSLLLCAYEISGNDTTLQTSIFKTFSKRCRDYSSYNYSWTYYEEQFKNATMHYIPLLQINTSLPVYQATLPNLKTLQSSYNTSQIYNYNIDSGTWFSVAICGYFLLLILFSAMYNFSRRFGITKNLNHFQCFKLLQKYLIFPTLFPQGKFSEPYGYQFLSMLFPNRIQFTTDFFLFTLQVAFYSAPYKYLKKSAWTRYVADRAGVMAFGKIPLLVLFAGRNNFLLWITGWSYSTFLHFHKVIAGWMLVDAVIHSVGYTIVVKGYYVRDLTYTYFACGVAATVLAGVLCLHSLHVFRKGFYEYFLAIHVVLAITFLIMCWYHCNTLGWMEWLVAACCVWFFDRLVRVIRMLAFGYKNATVSVIGDQMMKVEVVKPAWWKHTPGTYGFIYFAGVIFWENHPFTVVVEDGKICVYVRVKMGVTSRLWNKVNKTTSGKMTWKVCIEGPYGGSLTAMHKKYDDLLFLAGGSGVPGILEGATEAINGKVIWISQYMGSVIAYQKLIDKVNIPIDIYITRESSTEQVCSKKELFSGSESDSQSTEDSDKKSIDKEMGTHVSQIKISYGRPNLDDLLDKEVRDSNSKTVGIIACGPPRMMDNIRGILSRKVTTWEKSVDFFDEFQIW